jgi:hypothetical protein
VGIEQTSASEGSQGQPFLPAGAGGIARPDMRSTGLKWQDPLIAENCHEVSAVASIVADPNNLIAVFQPGKTGIMIYSSDKQINFQ